MAKILVRAPNWLGDAIMASPFLKRLCELQPENRVFVLCRPALRDYYRSFPGPAGLIVHPDLAEKGSFLHTVGRLRKERFDAGYALPPSFSSAFLLFAAGIPERIGYATDFRRMLLTRAFRLEERYHYVRRYLGLIGEEGRTVGAEELFFPVPAHGDERAEPFLTSRGVSFPGPILALAPGSQAPARRWFPERYAELINRMPESEWPVVLLLGAPSDRPVAKQVEGLAKRKVVNLCGETSLPLLGDVLRRCAALVTNESGLMHVAWAVGTPAVVLAGPSEPRLTSPFGARVRIIQRRDVPCVPCVRNECYRPAMEYKSCMTRIRVEEVVQALEAFSTGEAVKKGR